MLHEVRAFEPASVLACVVFVRDSLDVVIGLAFAASYALISGLTKRTTMLGDCIGNRIEQNTTSSVINSLHSTLAYDLSLVREETIIVGFGFRV